MMWLVKREEDNGTERKMDIDWMKRFAEKEKKKTICIFIR